MAANFVSTEELAKAAYGGCFSQYGHSHTEDLDKAWEYIGAAQQRMWYAVVEAVISKLQEKQHAAEEPLTGG